MPHEMRRITQEQALAEFSAQGVGHRDYAVKCPMCGTVQSMNTLVDVGAKPERVERIFAFSCEGRLTGAGPAAVSKDRSRKAIQRRKVRGCDWTLGGLFPIANTLLVDGERERPCFDIATPEEAQQLATARPLERKTT